MEKGTLKYIDSDTTVHEIFSTTDAELVSYDNNGTDTTVANFLDNLSFDTAETADVAEKAEKDLSGNVITSTYAPKNSPNFTGTPTAPTASDLDLLTNQVATVAWCNNVFKRFTGIVPENMDTLQEFWDALGRDSDLATTLSTELAKKQDKTDKLTAFSNLSLSADKLILATGENSFSTTALTSTGKSIISATDAKAIRKELGIYRHLVLDEIETNRWLLNGDSSISNVNAKFDKAVQLNSTNIYLDSVQLGGADFSVDFWAYIDSTCPNLGVLMSIHPTDFAQEKWLYISRNDSADGIAIGVDVNGENVREVYPNVSTVGELNHYEIDYNHAAQNLKFFVNGVLLFDRNSVTIPLATRYIDVGNFFYGSLTYPFAGAISEFRVSDCVRHSSNFTPPTEKYEVDEYTLSLLHFD